MGRKGVLGRPYMKRTGMPLRATLMKITFRNMMTMGITTTNTVSMARKNHGLVIYLIFNFCASFLFVKNMYMFFTGKMNDSLGLKSHIV